MNVSQIFPNLKSTGEGRFEGLAWSFATTPDREGDIILPSAFEVANKAVPLDVLIDHAGEPVGQINQVAVSDEGLSVAGAFDMGKERGRLAHRKVKSGEYSGLSVSFIGESEKSGNLRIFRKAELVEISVCRVPVNSGSRVTTVKSWGQMKSVLELETFLKSTGMPHRLAAKLAVAGWPVFKAQDEQTRVISDALHRIANTR